MARTRGGKPASRGGRGDPARVRADCTSPFAPAEGVDLAIVNGAVAFEDGGRTGMTGRLLRHRAAVAEPGA